MKIRKGLKFRGCLDPKTVICTITKVSKKHKIVYYIRKEFFRENHNITLKNFISRIEENHWILLNTIEDQFNKWLLRK